MNKQELIKGLSEKAGVSQKDAGAVLEAFIESVTETLKAKDKLTLIGFGIFEAVERGARVGRNPKTGEEINIPATVSPKFKPGKTLKDAIASNNAPKTAAKSKKDIPVKEKVAKSKSKPKKK